MSLARPRPEILVIDDDHELLEVLRIILAEEGYGVSVATDGESALAQLRAGLRPAAILLDLMMPGMNGWSFRDELSSDPALADIPIIILSGDHRSVSEDTPPNVAHRLRKPIALSTLLDVLKDVSAPR
jgi:CheY-like chemotaxis protein